MPGATLALRAVLAGHRAVALSGTRNFAAGGFAGTVHSTLTLRLGSTETSRPGQRPPRGVRRPQFRIVSVPMKLIALTGTVSQAISGVAGPEVCAVLDSCGLRGTITVQPHPTSGTGTLTVIGRARRPYRDFLAALGLSSSGRSSGLEAFGVVDVGGGGTLATSIVQGTTCHDASDLGPGELELIPGRGGLDVPYTPLGILKGRCPGPVMASADGFLASGVMPRQAIRRGRVTITLRGAGFTEDGFSARTSGSLRVTLTFGRPHQRIVTEP